MSDADGIRAEYEAAKRAYLDARGRLMLAKVAAVSVFKADMAAERRVKAARLVPVVEAMLAGASLKVAGEMLGMKTQPYDADVVYSRFSELVFTRGERSRIYLDLRGEKDRYAREARLALARMRELEAA